jgi:ubiquinone/menaquinone biosynthesis C-methylase UbiE
MIMNNTQQHLCPSWFSFSLDNRMRGLMYKPARMLASHVRVGMTVLDLGCGPGFFTLSMAELVGPNGCVIAADVQEEMLARVAAKMRGTNLTDRITLHRCATDRVGLDRQVDFALLFWVAHEIPNQDRMLRELRTIVKAGGTVLFVEPRGHVSAQAFAATLRSAEAAGFVIDEAPRVFVSRSALLRNP